MTPVVEHRFGPYGGQYVPETLMPALAELEQGWLAAREDPAFREALAGLLRDFAGRPTPLYRARRLSETIGAPVFLKREDLLHTGAHKLNNALGQSLLARRMGKTRVIAETGAGQHGVATATACALLDVECQVYMGTEDMRRQQPNVERMGLLGATVVPVDAGTRTLKEATSAAIRDWVANAGTTHYVIGSAVGPAPYPSLVRDLQRVIGDEARVQVLEQAERLPARVVACVGGGSNAIGTFTAFLDDDQVELVGVEAAGDGIETGRHGAPLTVGGRAGVLHGAMSAVLQDADGQILEAHSISAGLDYPGTGPQLAALRDAGRVRFEAVTDVDALSAFRDWRGWRGSSPRSRARTRSPGCWPTRPRPRRAAARLPLGARRQGPRRGPGSPDERAARHRGRVRGQRQARGAHALPDGRLPGPRHLAPDRRGLRRRRRRPHRARRAVLRPACRRAVHPRGGDRGAGAGATVDGVLEVGRALARRVPVALMATPTSCCATAPTPSRRARATAASTGSSCPTCPARRPTACSPRATRPGWR